MSDVPLREVYTDVFEHSFDDKGRITVPAEWRSEAHERRLHVMPSNDGCLKVYPASYLSEQRLKLAGVPVGDPRRKRLEDLARVIQSVEFDQQGRVMIKPRLRKGADLNKLVVLAGSLDHFEIWDRKKWEERGAGGCSFEDVAREVGW